MSWKLSFIKVGGTILEIDKGMLKSKKYKKISKISDLCQGKEKKKKRKRSKLQEKEDIDKDLTVQNER